MRSIVKIPCGNGNYFPFFRDELLDRFSRIDNDDLPDGTRSRKFLYTISFDGCSAQFPIGPRDVQGETSTNTSVGDFPCMPCGWKRR